MQRIHSNTWLHSRIYITEIKDINKMDYEIFEIKTVPNVFPVLCCCNNESSYIYIPAKLKKQNVVVNISDENYINQL
ncbi:hypothetical protein [Persephonella sp.]